MGENKLKKCPFCGNPNVRIVRYARDGFRDRYAVLCDYSENGCGAEGGQYHSSEEAVAAWNKRKRKWEFE